MRAGALHRRGSYWFLSSRPLHILVFLAPLVALYEVGSALYLSDVVKGTRQDIKAQRLLSDFFHAFGVAGLFLPGVALFTVLLVWHVLAGDRWRTRAYVLAGMLAESVAWTLPLLLLSALHARASAAAVSSVAALSAQGGGGGESVFSLPWQARLTVSVGAGLYEEMLFRLVGTALLHLVLADLLKIKSSIASVLAVIGAALAFALYHDTSLPAAMGGGTDWPKLIFLTTAGLYLGTLYILRGFGIVVGTHAVYDVLVLVLLQGR